MGLLGRQKSKGLGVGRAQRMRTRFVRSDTGDRGRTTSSRAFHGHTEDFGFSFEGNREPLVNFQQASVN